ncbi:MAG: metallophosphoesterase family protein [Candidatus Aminicenantes bacterium]|nr:metallophosphoesterase family protein [Candidatus Aminicenantes bacterium]
MSSEKKDTFKRLTEHKERALRIGLDIKNDKIAFVSDSHKWDRSDVDFFNANDPIYCEMLKQYDDAGFKLILLGDIEEGLGDSLKEAVEHYKNTFECEKRFVREKRYFRIYGNHDHDWKNPEKRKLLSPLLGDIEVYPAVMVGDKIIAAHGHEGDLFGDELRGFTKVILRLFRKFIDRLTGKKTSPAQNYKNRKKREEYLFEWARENHLLLITGHTHRPMFESYSPIYYLKKQKTLQNEALKLPEKDHPNRAELITSIESIDAHIRFFEENFPNDKEFIVENLELPYYFNSGSCIFNNGITAIEIDSGIIRLVWWKKTADGKIVADRTSFPSNNLEDILNKL